MPLFELVVVDDGVLLWLCVTLVVLLYEAVALCEEVFVPLGLCDGLGFCVVLEVPLELNVPSWLRVNDNVCDCVALPEEVGVSVCERVTVVLLVKYCDRVAA